MLCCTVPEGHIQTQTYIVLEMAALLCSDCVTLGIMLPNVQYIYSAYTHKKKPAQKNASDSHLAVISLWEIMLSLGRLC